MGEDGHSDPGPMRHKNIDKESKDPVPQKVTMRPERQPY